MSSFAVVLDACRRRRATRSSARQRPISIASTGAWPSWTRSSASGARHLIATLREIFPESEVTGYEQLIPSMPNDEKDRHVLAAAVVAGAQTIVTDHIMDFPEDALAPFGIEAQAPDEFLTHQFHLEPSTMARIVVEQAEDLTNPPMSVDQLLAVLSRHVPRFARLVGAWLADRR